jgi:hypothetical protein
MAINPPGSGIDPLASHRRTMEQACGIVDPMAEVRRLRERSKPVDPLASYRQTMGAVGSAYDNAMVESFRGRMQVELFNRKR